MSLAELRKEIAERNIQAEQDARGDMHRDLLRSALMCLFWCAAGLFLIGYALHTTDRTYGMAAFWGGIGVGNAGVIFTLLGVYRRGERRGDW